MSVTQMSIRSSFWLGKSFSVGLLMHESTVASLFWGNTLGLLYLLLLPCDQVPSSATRACESELRVLLAARA